MSNGAPDREHPDDLVSAHLDGELDPETSRWVEEHLDVCADCSAAAAEASAARQLVRQLPPVEGAQVVSRFLARHRASIRTGTAFVGSATVVLAALGLTAAVLHPEVVPDVDGLTAVHVAASEPGEGRAGPVDSASTGDVAEMRRVDGVGRVYAAPPAMLGSHARLSRHAVYDGDDLVYVVYRDGRATVSVFEQPGRLEWDALPAGELRRVGERPVWVREGSTVVMVTEVGDLVVTVVAEDEGAATTAVEGLPAARRGSTMDRLHDACARFTQTFALGG
jgi:hypothetical protein